MAAHHRHHALDIDTDDPYSLQSGYRSSVGAPSDVGTGLEAPTMDARAPSYRSHVSVDVAQDEPKPEYEEREGQGFAYASDEKGGYAYVGGDFTDEKTPQPGTFEEGSSYESIDVGAPRIRRTAPEEDDRSPTLAGSEEGAKRMSVMSGGYPTPGTPQNPHWGAPPEGRALRRNRTKKRVALTRGNLVIDRPIPNRLLSFLPRRGEEEFEMMRYTAVTCDVRPLPAPVCRRRALTLRAARRL